MKLLIIEEEPALARVLKKLFEDNDFEVNLAFSEIQTTKLIKKGNYDGIIIDVENDADRLVKKIRHIDHDVAMLGSMPLDDIDIDNYVFISKPFGGKAVLERMKMMLSKEEDVFIEVGNIVLSNRNKCLSSAMGSFDLSAMEYRIMEMLMKNYDQNFDACEIEKMIQRNNCANLYVNCINRKLKVLHANIVVECDEGRYGIKLKYPL